MLSPIPRRNRWIIRSYPVIARAGLDPATAAFPVLKPGRLPHHLFRGLLDVHCTLRPADSRSRLHDPFHQRLRRFRYLHRRSDCYRLERELPGGYSPTENTRLVTAHFNGLVGRVPSQVNSWQVACQSTRRFLEPKFGGKYGGPTGKLGLIVAGLVRELPTDWTGAYSAPAR
jgi:hypothetical protein